MARQARFVYTLPDGSEHEHALDPADSTTIGRHPQCTITVTQPSVSRRHVRIWHETGSFLVEDLNSSNGTYINGQRITRATLTEGCELRCGDFALNFSTTADAAPPPRSAPSGRPKLVARSLRPRRPSPAAMRPTSNRMPSPDELRPTDDKPVLRKAGRLPPEAAEPRSGRREPEPPPEPRSGRREPEPPPEPRSGRREPLPSGRRPPLPRDVASDPGTREAPSPGRLIDDGELHALREQVEEKADLIHARDRRIRELEDDVRHAEEQLTTQTEKALDLRDQATQLQSQLEETRSDRNSLIAELNAVKDRLETLRDTQQAAAGREQELAEQVNDLKREVMHREKAKKEVERELELAAYDLKTARDDNENLRLALGDDDSTRKKLNTRLAHLEQILEEKESMIEILQRNEERMEDKLKQARADARLEGGQRSARLQEQLNRAEEERDALTGQVGALEGELATLKEKAGAATSGRARELQEQVTKLKRENRDLRRAVEDAKATAGEARTDATVEATLTAAREALDQAKAEATRLAQEKLRLEAALSKSEDARQNAEDARSAAELAARKARARKTVQEGAEPPSGGGGGDFDGLRDAAVKTYETLNDLASDLRNNVRVGGDYVNELKGLVELVAKTPDATDAIRDLAEDIDALLTIESAVETLGAAQAAARNFKKAMRQFRETLQQFGYGS